MGTSKVDIVILTVIPQELAAAKAALSIQDVSDNRIKTQNSETIYLRGELFSERNHRNYRIALGCIGRAGNYDSSAAATEVIEVCDPQLVVLMGIAAGIKGKAKLGEVVFSEQIVGYESAALRQLEDGTQVVQPRPEMLTTPNGIHQDVIFYLATHKDQTSNPQQQLISSFHHAGGVIPELLVEDEAYLQKSDIVHGIEIDICAIASGEKLLKDPSVLKGIRDNQHGRVKVGEMEAIGFSKACQRMRRDWLVIRGVSDFGDAYKSDIFHPLASQTAAIVLADFLKYGLDLGKVLLQEPHEQVLDLVDRQRQTRLLPDLEISDTIDRIIKEHEFFVSRPEQNQLDSFLCEHRSGLLLVTSDAGFGKTSLLANWIAKQQDESYFIVRHFFNQRDGITRSLAKAYRNLLWQLHSYFEFRLESLPDSEEDLRREIYNLIRERNARVNQPLVIVLDALDEAEEVFSPFFQKSLPENVFLIVSARANEEESPEYLNRWIDSATQVVYLKRLPREAIVEWLKQSDNGQLAKFSEDNHFINRLDEVTEGFPLYLSYLIEELGRAEKQGQDIQSLLEQTPVGFRQYVKQQLKYLDKLELPDKRRQFFALLTVAKGTLEKKDIKAITEMRDPDLRQLHQCWQVTRWMKISQEKFYAFTHPALGIAFADQLGDEAEDALQNLIDHCKKWQNHHSFYALRHYADHLQDNKQWDELYELARNSEFANAQRNSLPNEPGLSLKTIQTALRCASDTDNAVVMAEFLLKHAHQLINIIARECPLKALRTGNLNQALSLVELYAPQPKLYILWHLLLAWELKETNKREAADEILRQLLAKNLFRFDRSKTGIWQCNIAASLLAYIFEINPETCITLSQNILSDDDRWAMCQDLCNQGYYVEAFDMMRLQIERMLVDKSFNNLFEIERIQKILEVQAEKVSKGAALESLSKIADLLSTPGWESCFASEWAALASFQVRLEENRLGKAHFKIAISIAKRVSHQGRKTQEFLSIIYHLTKAGEANSLFWEDALDLLQSEDIRTIDTSELYSRVVFAVKIAEIQALLSRLADAQETLKKTQAFTEQIEDFEERMECYIDIGKAYVDIGDFDCASEIANETSGYVSVKQEGILSHLWRKQAESKDEAQNQIDNREEIQNENLEAMVFDQIKACRFEEARSTLSLLLRSESAQEIPLLKAWTLVEIAEVQLRAEVTQSVLSTIQAAAQFADEVKDRFTQALLSANLAEQWAKLGCNQKSETALHQALSIARVIRAEQKNRGTWSVKGECSHIFATVAETQARLGDFDAALETIEMIVHASWLKADVLKLIAQEQSKSEAEPTYWEKLKKILAAIYEEAQADQFSFINDCIQALCTLAVAESIIEDQQAALETLRYLHEQAEGRDESKILAKVAVAEIQIQGIDAALETLKSIDDPEWRMHVLWSVANTQFKHGSDSGLLSTLDTARETYAELKDEKKRLNGMEKIIGMQAMAGFSYQSTQPTEKFLESREPMLSMLAHIYADAGNLQNFKQMLIPCAHYLEVAYEMCSYLAKLYPERASEIVRVLDNDY